MDQQKLRSKWQGSIPRRTKLIIWGGGWVRSLQHDACGPPATGFEALMVLGSGARGHTTGGGREICEGELSRRLGETVCPRPPNDTACAPAATNRLTEAIAGSTSDASNIEVQAARRGYGWTWHKFRSWYLAQNPLCKTCEAKTPPLFTGAREVDHVVPLRDGGGQYELSNLQPLCGRCHRRKTHLETNRRFRLAHGLGGGGNFSGSVVARPSDRPTSHFRVFARDPQDTPLTRSNHVT